MTAPPFEISSEMCSNFRLQPRHLPQSWPMGRWLPGEIQTGVVSWGAPEWGGDCTAVQEQLKNVQQLQATVMALAAILSDGSVIAWGEPERGGDCSAVQDQLQYLKIFQHLQDDFHSDRLSRDYSSEPGVCRVESCTGMRMRVTPTSDIRDQTCGPMVFPTVSSHREDKPSEWPRERINRMIIQHGTSDCRVWFTDNINHRIMGH